jgi:hypothetical protein
MMTDDLIHIVAISVSVRKEHAENNIAMGDTNLTCCLRFTAICQI